MSLIEIFEMLNCAYEKIGEDSLNRRQICGTLEMMRNGEFFALSKEKQRGVLMFYMELFLGRGNAFWDIEDRGGVAPGFWLEFKQAIFDYLGASNEMNEWP